MTVIERSVVGEGCISGTFGAIGTTATVVLAEPRELDRAVSILRSEIDSMDRLVSRFRPDSELERRVHSNSGRVTRISPSLFRVLDVAQRVAERTEGAVDPTVCNALEALGYDRDFGEIDGNRRAAGPESPSPVPGFGRVVLDARTRSVHIPKGLRLDLGATAKALIVDRATIRIHEAVGVPVLVSLGGDLAVAGGAPTGGWPIGIAVDSSVPSEDADQVVTIGEGGLASSSTQVRAWSCGQATFHHIVDPATGTSADSCWTVVSCAGPSCVDANALSTAAIVWGRTAPDRLVRFGQPARLCHRDGGIVTVNGWPE